ncbi:MAG: sigma 54-interacting transcriptional regulator, partial [Candidatus Krumholzibacteria bacterium]|nr:sigma 54-interacting transcriptional regulator [Candidatus Krumholzibacteria bacterium]
MLGQIFHSRYLVETLLHESPRWQAFEARDIINQRRSLVLLFPPLPSGDRLDRSSLAWRLSRFREILGDSLAPSVFGEEGESLTILCDLPPEAQSWEESKEDQAACLGHVREDLLRCQAAGFPGYSLDRHSIRVLPGGRPCYLPSAFLFPAGSGPVLFPEEDELSRLARDLDPAARELDAGTREVLEETLAHFRNGETVLLAVRTGLHGGLSPWSGRLERALRDMGGHLLEDPSAPLFFLESFQSPSWMFHPLLAELSQTGEHRKFVLVYDANSLDDFPHLEQRIRSQLTGIREFRQLTLTLPDSGSPMASVIPEGLCPEELSFLELLALLDEPAPLPLLSRILRIAEEEFFSLLSGLSRRLCFSLDLGSVGRGSWGLQLSLSSRNLRQDILDRLPKERRRELHFLVLGFLNDGEGSKPGLPLCRLRHLRGSEQKESLLKEGLDLFAMASRQGWGLVASEVCDLLLEDSELSIPPRGIRDLFLFLGERDMSEEEDEAAELRYREGLVRLSGHDRFLEELLEGQGFDVLFRGKRDASLLSPASSLLRAIADLDENRGDFQRAESILQGFLDACSEQLSARERGILNNDLAWILYRKGEHEASVERCEIALRLFDKDSHFAELGQTFNTLGAAHWALSQWREAETYYQRAVALREKAGNPARIAASLNNLGNLYRMMDRLPIAIEHFQRSMDIKKKIGNEAGYLASLYNVALCSFEMGDMKMARSQCQESLELNQRVRNRQLEAEVRGLLGEIEHFEGRLEEAAGLLEEAILICEEIGARTELVSMYRRMLAVQLDLGNLEEAKKAIKQGLGEARRVSSRFEEAQILAGEGEYYLNTGDAPRALQSYESAADLFSVLDKAEFLARVYSQMGLIHLDLGEELSARESLNQATAIIERRRITVPMPAWDRLQASLHSQFQSGGDSEGEGLRLQSFYRLLELVASPDFLSLRLREIADCLRAGLPFRRLAFLSLLDPKHPETLFMEGDFSDLEDLAGKAGKMTDAVLDSENDRGRAWIPLGGEDPAFLFLEKDGANWSESDREFLLSSSRLLSLASSGRKVEAGKKPARLPSSATPSTPREARLLGKGRDMNRVLKLVRQVRDLDTSVLIAGESGTGKEEVARAIHFGGLRSSRPFVPVNCASIPETLLESILFGHERGAFTGATHRHVGFFEEASGGTIFLDEIGEMSADMQAKLLRVIQEKQFIRVGGTRSMGCDVRILTATNRDLSREVEAGRFREDLFYRINVISIQLAPLRDKREDIPLLVDHFL